MKFRLLVLVLLLSILLIGCQHKDKELKTVIQDQNKTVYELNDYIEGKVWMGTFINFENMEETKSKLSNMNKIAQELDLMDVSVPIVIFNANPTKNDDKKVRAILNELNIHSQIKFLYGYDREFIESISQKKFKSIILNHKKEFLYNNNIFLFEKEGQVYKEFPGIQAVPFDLIIREGLALLETN